MPALTAALGFSAALALAYTAGADAYARRLAPWVIRHAPVRPAVGLTFDDGPDPVNTPRLLDLLAGHGARATFFLLGAAAARHPGLVRRMVAEGHALGVHSWRHRHAWLTGPRETARDLARCLAVLEELTGRRPRWFRPPWGYFNAALLAALPRHGLRPVLWSATGHDWGGGVRPESVARRVLRDLTPGGIVLLHDHTPATGATQAMLAALPHIIRHCALHGWRLVTLDELLEPVPGDQGENAEGSALREGPADAVAGGADRRGRCS